MAELIPNVLAESIIGHQNELFHLEQALPNNKVNTKHCLPLWESYEP